MAYVITWQDRDEQVYHVDGELHGTPFINDADEFTKEEALQMIDENEWFNCTIEEV